MGKRSVVSRILALCYLAVACNATLEAEVRRFSGGLQGVSPQGEIVIRLPDGVAISARLPGSRGITPEQIAQQFRFADRVEIVCHSIDPRHSQRPTYRYSNRYRVLVLKTIRFLRRPSNEELEAEIACREWQVTCSNLLKGLPSLVNVRFIFHIDGRSPTCEDAFVGAPIRMTPGRASEAPASVPSAPEDSDIEYARRVNSEFTSLPDVWATEITRHYASESMPPKWRPVLRTVWEVLLQRGRIVRQRFLGDDRRFNYAGLGGLPGFEACPFHHGDIRPVFDPRCSTSVRFAGHQELFGRHVRVYEFSSPDDGCFARLAFGYQSHFAGQAGRVFIEDPGGKVVQLQSRATALPATFEIAGWEEETTFDRIRFGELEYTMPVSSTTVIRSVSGGAWRVETQFAKFRLLAVR